MELALTPAEEARAATVRDALAAWGDRDRVRAAQAGADGFDPQLLQGFAAAGWCDASGAPGAPSCTELALAMVEVGRHPAPGPFLAMLATPSAVLGALGRRDGARAAARLAPATAWCGDGADVTGTASGAGWVLDGRAPLVPFGRHAERLLIPASCDGAEAVAVFTVDAGAGGVDRVEHDTVGDDRPATVALTGVELTAAACLADDVVVDDLLDVARVARCAELVGAAEAALAVAVAYVCERPLFGRPVGSYQAVQHRLADRHVDVVAMRAAVLDAAGRADRGLPFAVAASTAQVVCTEGALRVTADAHQVHGGEGFYADRDPGLLYRRVRGLAPRLGDVRHHLERLDRLRRAATP